MSAGGGFDFSVGVLEWPIPTTQSIVRIHHQDNGPVWFGPGPGRPPVYRFDAPGGEFRVMYGAERMEGAFAETVLRKSGRQIKRDFVAERVWTEIVPPRPLVLLQAFGAGLSYVGADGAISTMDRYEDTQRFALEVHRRFPHIDGIAYKARHNNTETCYALFDRCETPEPFAPADSARFDQNWGMVESIMRRHGARWDHLPPTPPAP